jgi:hypothetical protein
MQAVRDDPFGSYLASGGSLESLNDGFLAGGIPALRWVRELPHLPAIARKKAGGSLHQLVCGLKRRTYRPVFVAFTSLPIPSCLF